MRITQSLLGRITTQMPTSLPAFCACAEASGTSKPSASPPPATAAEPTMNLRREISRRLSRIVLVMADLPDIRICGCRGRRSRAVAIAGRQVHGRADALIGAAAADIGHRLVDVLVGRARRLPQQRRRRHDLAGLAEAALRHVERRPGPLHRMRRVARQSLDGDDAVGRLHVADAHRAGAHDLAVDVNGAGAALRDAAAVFGAGEPDLFADDPQQRRIGRHLHVAILAIDVESCHSHPPKASLIGDAVHY